MAARVPKRNTWSRKAALQRLTRLRPSQVPEAKASQVGTLPGGESKQPSKSSRSPPVEAAATIPPPDDLEGQLAEIVGMHPLKIQLRKFHQTCKDNAEIRALGLPPSSF